LTRRFISKGRYGLRDASLSLFTNCCIPRLYDVVDDLEPLFEVGECALHRVDGDPLEVVQRPVEGVGTLGELARH